MKKYALIMLALGGMVFAGCQKNEKSQVALPDLAAMFVSQHYGDADIESVANDSANVYDVKLSNGATLNFNVDGMWTKVSAGEGGSVSSKVLPYAAAIYLEQIYTGKTIKLVERDIPTGLMRVTLDDGLEIVFTSEGEVV
ncbi:MAG: PepSY-like domain-containing protein [Muribaculaceae bacterium]